MTVDELLAACDAAASAGVDGFPVSVPGHATSYRMQVLPGLWGRVICEPNHGPPRIMVWVNLKDIRRWVERRRRRGELL